VRDLSGMAKFKRNDAGQMKLIALDANGEPQQNVGSDAAEIKLQPSVLYYLVSK
jgi:hypothetical protein